MKRTGKQSPEESPVDVMERRQPSGDAAEPEPAGTPRDAAAVENTIRVSDIDIRWDTANGSCTFEGLPVAMMWIDTTLAGLMSGVQAMVGTERFVLALQSEGRKSVAADWEVISAFPEFADGFAAIARIAAVAGWGDWRLASLDLQGKSCRFEVRKSWEGRYQKALGVCWGSGMAAGKFAGYCSRLFETNCWAEQTAWIARGDDRDAFTVQPSERSVETEIENLLATGEATRADMAVALHRLRNEVRKRRQTEEEREALITELEAKNAELERFIYTVSHDLKAPLITIKGFLGLIEQDTEAGDIEKLRTDRAQIDRAATRMHQMLEELLELSRIGRLAEPAQEVDMADVAREAVGLLQGAIRERGVKVVVEESLPTVWGDRQRLLEVLQNLVDNAVKFSGEERRPRVEVGLCRDGETDVIYVRDNGIGIAPNYQAQVFDLFERLDADVEGTGIGLSLVRRIVMAHGGTIWLESEGEGKGCTFCFTLAPGEPPEGGPQKP